MSKSPRRLLGRAAGALAELAALEADQPEARAQLVAALGPDGLARLAAAADVIRGAAARLDKGTPSASDPPSG